MRLRLKRFLRILVILVVIGTGGLLLFRDRYRSAIV